MRPAASVDGRPGPDALVQLRPLPSYVAPRASATTYWRRRLLALVLVLMVAAALGWGAGRVTAALGAAPASAPERVPVPGVAPSAAGYRRAVHVVHRGDTLWSVARALQPSGDVRALVRALSLRNGGSSLEVGQVLVMP